MPTEVRFNRRPSRTREILDAVLVHASRCLIAIAVSLVTLIVVQLEIESWRAGDVDQGVPPELQVSVTSP